LIFFFSLGYSTLHSIFFGGGLEIGSPYLCTGRTPLWHKKYLGEKGVFRHKKHDGSQFWKGLMAVREDVARGVVYEVGKGKK
jgi:hypothetical protein